MTKDRRQPPNLAAQTDAPDAGSRLVGAFGKLIGIVMALLAGAVLGAGLTTGWMFVAGLATNHAGPDAGRAFAPIIFYIALPIWTIGLLAIGLPVLGLLYATGVRSRRVAAVFGALLVGLVETAWMGLPAPSGHNFAVLVLFFTGQVLAGAIVGSLVAHVAYGPQRRREVSL